MKTISESKNLRSLSLSLFALILLTLAFTSCKKDKKDVNVDLSAFVRVTNASAASTPQDFFLDTTKLTASAVAYGSSTDYLKTTTGDHQGSFKNSGSATVNVSFNLSLAAGKYYSAFYSDSSKYATFIDDRTTPQAGKARIRFINLSSALASSVDFGATGAAKLVSSLAYKSASAYYDVDPTTAFSLYASGSTTAIISLPTTIEAGHIYTIYVSGATTGTVTSHLVTEN